MPCHYTLESGLHLYIEALRTTALQAGAPLDSKGYIFSNARSPADRRTAHPIRQPGLPHDPRGATNLGIDTRIGSHSFRATGITEYLHNGSKHAIAQQMTNHESTRATGIYHRRNNQPSLDERERILI